MKNVLIFVAGAATGAFVTYKFVAKYYKDEFNTLQEFFKGKEKIREVLNKSY